MEKVNEEEKRTWGYLFAHWKKPDTAMSTIRRKINWFLWIFKDPYECTWTKPIDRQEKYNKVKNMIGIPVEEHSFDSELYDTLKNLIEVCIIINGT